MGFAIADACRRLGAEVTVVHGPVVVSPKENYKTISVQTAAEMFSATAACFSGSEIVIFAAAVADYTPKHPAAQKIKKSESEFSIELMKTKDIAFELGKQKQQQFLVGFALETENEQQNALLKLKKKNLDMIVLNSLQDAGAGFQYDTNKIAIIDKNGERTDFPLRLKDEVARDILTFIEQKCQR